MPPQLPRSRRPDGDLQITGGNPPMQRRFRLPPPANPRPPVEAIVISSDDEIQVPPAKRLKTTPKSAGPSNPRPPGEPSNANLKRKQPSGEPKSNKPRPYLLIDLTECDELVQDTDVQQPPKKKQKSSPKNETRGAPILISDSEEEIKEEEEESDSDYDNFHDGFDVGWSTSLVEQDEHMFDLEVDWVGKAVARLQLNRVDPRILHNSRKSAPLLAVEATNSQQNVGFRFMGASAFRLPPSSRTRGPVYASYNGGRSRTGVLKHRPPQLQTPLGGLKLFSRFRMADACQSISQSSSKILMASSTPGGTMEDDGDGTTRIDPYNSRNTLALWTEDTREQWLPAHYVQSAQSSLHKYYDISLARFDPTNSNIFASTGLDGSLSVWKNMRPTTNKLQNVGSADVEEDISARYVEVKQWRNETYRGCCHDIIFRPKRHPEEPTVFAAPCDDGKVYLHSYTEECNSFSPVRGLQLKPRGTHKAGATAWGWRTTSKRLFVCSEAEDSAPHGAFDTTTAQLLYYFDQRESGEELALDPHGRNLALLTNSEESQLRLRLYDVGNDDNHHTALVALPQPSQQLPTDATPEVGVVSWSPDGILLAVGCNDDVVHVYDVRCLRPDPVLSLRHETRSSSRGLPLLSLPEEERAESKNSFGITVLAWTAETCFKSPGMGLLTGGGDHCIALWDVKTAARERRVVAELDGHVGVAHFGDLSKGEKPLVAGDTDGHVYIYDFVERD